jgi:hypothetical protein
MLSRNIFTFQFASKQIMETPVPGSMPQPENQDGYMKKPPIEHASEPDWAPGPTLGRPSWWRRKSSICGYALRRHFIQISTMVIVLLLIIDLVLRWDELRPPLQIQISMEMIEEIIRDALHVLVYSTTFFQNVTVPSSVSPIKWVDWWVYVQSLLGIGTLLVALFFWYGEIKEDWENSLPKRMSVFFIHKGRPVIVCRYIWLAGDDDLRAWGQQVAAQAVGERFLSFYPNVEAQIPSLAIWIDGKICRHSVACFELMEMNKEMSQNLFLAKYPDMCRYQNIAAGTCIVSSVPLRILKEKVSASVFPFKWAEESDPNSIDISSDSSKDEQ